MLKVLDQFEVGDSGNTMFAIVVMTNDFDVACDMANEYVESQGYVVVYTSKAQTINMVFDGFRNPTSVNVYANK